MANMSWSFPAGQIRQEVTSLTLVNNTAKTLDTTVPTGKVWRLRSIRITNPDNVDRNVTITLYKEAAKTNVIKIIHTTTSLATTAQRIYNTSIIRTTIADSGYIVHDEALDTGNTISIVWAAGGASAGATDADGQVVCYEEVAVSQ